MSDDLFNASATSTSTAYSAKDIEVLEGLEPVRMRPGMYIGGTDERAFHHLAAEVLDNSMDEAVAGHASVIDLELSADGALTIRDNGRGIPVDPHPKYPEKSALEVILTTLHSGGKFNSGAYKVSGGLHGVGISVVNALSDAMTVEVARDRVLWRQEYSRGHVKGPLEKVGAVNNRRGTTISFRPDPEIFGERLRFKPAMLYRMARSKAYLFKGVELRWRCDPVLLEENDVIPAENTFHFPNGLKDFLTDVVTDRPVLTQVPFFGEADLPGGDGRVEWAVAWPDDNQDGFLYSYCNTIPTPQGGTHEAGFRSALGRATRSYAEMANNKKAQNITSDDLLGGACLMLSVFIPDPQFQGQTKEKLASADAARLVETAVKDHFDHWLSANPDRADAILEYAIERADERRRRKKSKEMSRKSATKRMRLPGKLTDCTRSSAAGSELFIVEGDSAGGSAKQARSRETQAVLPLRGKILNVASATTEKMYANQEIKDLIEALGCGTRKDYDDESLRYERIIIMTDADVDGAHIAALLMTFFYQEMRGLIENGHLFLAMPPLFRITQGSKSAYALDEEQKDQLLETEFTGKGKLMVSRFKGLGEMPPAQLKETTMDPAKRVLIRVTVPRGKTEEDIEDVEAANQLVDDLMGRKADKRFHFIQENARFVDGLDV